MPRPAVPPETYAEYPLIILSQDGKKEIAHVTPDENGKYRVAARRLYSRCERPRGETRPHEAATIHGCRELNG